MICEARQFTLARDLAEHGGPGQDSSPLYRGIEMTVRTLFPFLIATCLLALGCDRREPSVASDASSPLPVSQSDVQRVDPSTVQLGPIQRDSLSPEQMERIRKLQAVFVEVDGMSVEQWVDNFKRDLDPDRELEIWEVMAKAYTSFCSTRTLSSEAKREVYKVVLLRSMASEQEVLQRLDLEILTKDDAIAVMRGF